MNFEELLNINDKGFKFNKKEFDLKLYKTEEIERIDDPNFVRTYLTPNRKRYVSVTSMLSIVSNKDFLTPWKKKLARNRKFWHKLETGEELSKEQLDVLGEQLGTNIAEASADSGTYMHDTLEDYVLGNTLEYRKSQAFLVENLAPILNDNLGEVYLVEGQLWSDELELAGTLDLCAMWNGSLSIIDYKNSIRLRNDKFNADYYIQSCIYALMVQERFGVLPEKIVILVSINSKFSQIRHQEFVVNVKDILPKLEGKMEIFRQSDIYKELKSKGV